METKIFKKEMDKIIIEATSEKNVICKDGDKYAGSAKYSGYAVKSRPGPKYISPGWIPLCIYFTLSTPILLFLEYPKGFDT